MLHVFPQACNLVDDRGEVLSLVSSDVGPGPFAAVVEGGGFSRWVEVESPVAVESGMVRVGPLRIATNGLGRALRPGLNPNRRLPPIWNPRPSWEQITPELLARALPRLRSEIALSHTQPAISKSQFPDRLNARFLESSSQIADAFVCLAASLAGRGPGLRSGERCRPSV